MRTTLTLDDDVLRVAKQLAHEQERALGQVVSELARRGLYAGKPYSIKESGSLPRFRVREDSPPITSADVKSDEDSA